MDHQPRSSAEVPSGGPSLGEPAAVEGAARAVAEEPRNLALLALHQIVFRLGWVFKTESVIMPAFVDAISGAGWLRGCLPLLTRLGQSIPPVLGAAWLGRLPLKRRALSFFSLAMALCFAVLAGAWWGVAGRPTAWMPPLFLVLYFLFFVSYGLYQLSLGTLQGKLIRPQRRGRLLAVSTFGGLLPALVLAMWWLRDWLSAADGGFGRCFVVVAACFALAGLVAAGLREAAEPPVSDRAGPAAGRFRDAWRALAADRNLRCLAVVGALFSPGLMLAPHYVAYSRARLGLTGTDILVWIVAQNVSVSLASLLVGPLADRRGYRLVLRGLILVSAATPLVALAVTRLEGAALAGAVSAVPAAEAAVSGVSLFWLVYGLLGISPLVPVALMNYALELSPARDHPRYLSTLNVCLLAPFVASPAVGWAIDAAGFEAVFILAALLCLAGGALSWRLDEPRHRSALAGARAGRDNAC